MGASFAETFAGQTMNLDLTKTFVGSKEFSALCTDLFLIVIRMREAEDLGEPAPLQKLINYYLNLFKKNCATLGVDAETIDEAMYALIALIDETVLSVPGPCRDYWFNKPLQLEYFGDNLAGEGFYNKLQKMLLAPEKKKDVLEIYYICLSLGFEGKYKMGNTEDRVAIMEDLGRKIRRTRMRVSAELSPHGRSTDAVAPKKKGNAAPYPLWLAAAVFTGAAAAAWVLLLVRNNAQFNGVFELIRPMVSQ